MPARLRSPTCVNAARAPDDHPLGDRTLLAVGFAARLPARRTRPRHRSDEALHGELLHIR
jgi:hypothetical protein